MRTLLVIGCIALAAFAASVFHSDAAWAGVQAPVGGITLTGTGPVNPPGSWGGTSTGTGVTVEGWGYAGGWDDTDGSYVGPPRLYLNADGTYNLVDSSGKNVGSGTWTHP
jgi:hypothetical protein